MRCLRWASGEAAERSSGRIWWVVPRLRCKLSVLFGFSFAEIAVVLVVLALAGGLVGVVVAALRR
jgi:hypothetical protein